MWLIDPEIFQHPFTCILSGPTMCGKTHLLKEILKNKHVLINPSPQRIIICYKAWQNFYQEFKRFVPDIEFHEGIYEIDNLNQNMFHLKLYLHTNKEKIPNLQNSKFDSPLNSFGVFGFFFHSPPFSGS